MARTISYPFDTVVYITDSLGQGSGVLIAPDEVLTAAHVVYSTDFGLASSIVVTPAYQQGDVPKPFGSAAGTSVHYKPIFNPDHTISLEQSQFDFAVIHLSRSFDLGAQGYEANFGGGYVYVAGYPANANGGFVLSHQYVLPDFNFSILHGTSLGEGSSGGPIWVNDASGPHVVGVVSSGSQTTTDGYFPYITSSMFNILGNWVTADHAQFSGQTNVAYLGGNSWNYSVSLTPNASTLVVTDKVGLDGVETLRNVQSLWFSDQTIDATQFIKTASLSAAQLVDLVDVYIASFNRAPDALGLDYWGSRLHDGMSLQNIAKSFFVQPEAAAFYPVGESTQAFASQVYKNVLNRDPDAAGLAYWVGQLQSGQVSKDAFLLAIINGAQANARAGGDQQILASKVLVGAHFALTQGLSDAAWAKTVMAGVDGSVSSIVAANGQADAFADMAATVDHSELVVKIVGIVG